MKLRLLHFNDLHGRLEQMPRLATLIGTARREARAEGRAVLVLDGGDSSDRGVWESDITKGRANFALLEAIGVQASVVGNGEALQWGRAALEKLVGSVSFPVLAANLVDLAEPTRLAVPGLRGSAVLDCEGLRLGLVGITAVYANGYERFGYVSADPRPALRREIDALRAQGAQLLMLLSHSGVAPDPAQKATWRNPHEYTDEVIARDYPELAVIVGGHSHTSLAQPLVVGQTLIVQAGAYGQALGVLDLDVDEATGLVRGYQGRLLPCGPEASAEPTIAATLELATEEAGRLLELPLSVLAAELPHTADSQSPFAQWVADALREVTGADLAIFFSGFGARGLPAGPVTRRHLYEALPGSAHVTAARVTGAQIHRMVERMLASKYRTEPLSPQRGGPPLGLPAASSNVRLVYDVDSHALTQCLIDGQPLAPEQQYHLASTYFTLNDDTDDPDYDFIGLAPGQVIEMVQVEKVLWEVVEGHVKMRGGM